MAKKLEEILKSKGWADADLEAAKTLLADPRFRGALEEEYGALESRAAKAEQDSQGWANWFQETGNPAFLQAQKAEQDARAEAAAANARLKALQDQGLIAVAEAQGEPAVAQPASASEPFDPKKHNLVTYDDARKLADAEGDFMAQVADLQAEYAELNPGKSILTYTTQTQDGRTLKGFRALRYEATQKKHPGGLPGYVAEKFEFDKRRAEIAAKAAADHDEQMRKEGEARIAARYGNPDLRTPVSSSYPMLPKPNREGGAKQPWEEEGANLSGQRVQRALAKALTVTN